MKVTGIQKTTLIDYPGKIATTLFTPGCNMRCPYCHNKQIAFDFEETQLIDMSNIYELLEQRKNFIDAVVVTGGEPTLQPDLLEFLEFIKNHFKLLIKLDTNGSNPMIVRRAINEKLVDYVALDIKTSFSKYQELLGVDGDLIYATYRILKESTINYELRMTCYPDFIDSDKINEIMPLLSQRDRIFLQKCNVNKQEQHQTEAYSQNQLELFGDMFTSEGFSSTLIRGIA